MRIWIRLLALYGEKLDMVHIRVTVSLGFHGVYNCI